MANSLFERLGGNVGITAIANDAVDNHIANTAIANRFMLGFKYEVRHL
ncbi:hypothetical protein [Vibrio sp. WZ-1]